MTVITRNPASASSHAARSASESARSAPESAKPAGSPKPAESAARATLAACFLGMFVVTLDAVVVNVALPHMRTDLGGGMSGLQWVVDGYTLMVAALLLSAGAVSDRLGAKRLFGIGMGGFVLASLGCGLAPSLGLLVVARVVQGISAAMLMPTSMALIGQAYSDPFKRAKAVGVWAMGGAVASSAGPVVGGALSEWNWRAIFLINLPVGVIALWLLRRSPQSPTKDSSFDIGGLILAALAMGGLTWAAIESGSRGLTSTPALGMCALAVLAGIGLWALERRLREPMLPPELLGNRTVAAFSFVGFAFMACYYGTPFVMSLDLQGQRGLSSMQTGLAFLPMMLIGLVLTPASARLVERFGRRQVMVSGLVTMAVGLLGLGMAPASAPVWALSALMVLVGIAGPTVMPPATAALLNAVEPSQSGTASGVLNTSRQVGGALAVAVFGALLASSGSFHTGVLVSMAIAAVLTLLAAGVARVRL